MSPPRIGPQSPEPKPTPAPRNCRADCADAKNRHRPVRLFERQDKPPFRRIEDCSADVDDVIAAFAFPIIAAHNNITLPPFLSLNTVRGSHPSLASDRMSTDDLSFDSYCIVCDRLIVQPPEPVVVVEKKKKATGTIRVKNADGTTTTRNANGVKTTRPAMRRNPASAARLAALANHTKTGEQKLGPLVRTSTSESLDGSVKTAASKSPSPSPTSETPVYRSEIYCSRECAHADAGRSSATFHDIARTLSLDCGIAPLGGPPSPLCFSSDTDSSASLKVSDRDVLPATSAPKTMEFFRMRDAPDDAWREYEREKARQRRSSMAARPYTAAGAYALAPMTRQRSGQSTSTGYSLSGASSDSLASLWHESEPSIHRTTSGNGAMRAMTPLHAREAHGAGHRSMSSSSDGSSHSGPSAHGARPINRSSLSQTSLALASSPQPSLPEFGASVPAHTAYLQSYALAFPARDPSGLSTSFKAGFHPGSATPSSSLSMSRRESFVAAPTPLGRPLSGTIKARPRNEHAATWDSFGRDEVNARHREHEHEAAPRPIPERGRPYDATPKQSLEVENGRWKIKYTAPGFGGGAAATAHERSRSRVSLRSAHSVHSNDDDARAMPPPAVPAAAISIPSRPTSSPQMLSSSSTGQTPRTAAPAPVHCPAPAHAHAPRVGQSVPHRAASAMPDLAALRLGASPSAAATDYVSVGALAAAAGKSLPRAGFDWERRGTKTYELPKGLVSNPNKGLFYFNA
ncbi:hypothetical protein Q5752_000902 [Cryptotrichosporon argae]